MAKTDFSAMIKQVHVAYAKDAAQADRMIAALKEAGIQASLGGGVRDIYSTGSALGQEIMVAPDDADRAREIILALQPDPSAGRDAEGQKGGKGRGSAGPVLRAILMGVLAIICIILLAFIKSKTGV